MFFSVCILFYRNLNKDYYVFEDRGLVPFKGRTEEMHCWFLNGHQEREPTEVTLEQARRISSLLDSMAEAEELRRIPLSPLGAAVSSPRTSFGDAPPGSNRHSDSTSISLRQSEDSLTIAPRVRKRSSVKAPARDALESVPDHPLHRSPDVSFICLHCLFVREKNRQLVSFCLPHIQLSLF